MVHGSSTNSCNLDTNEKPFSCYCGASFSRRDLLRRHERVSCHLDRLNDPLAQTVNGAQLFVVSDHSNPPHSIDGHTIGHGKESHYHADLSAYQTPPSLNSSTHLDSFP